MFTVSPNPSSSQIEVTIDNSNTAYEKSKPVYTSNFISEIQIADMSGNVVSKQRYDGRQSTAVLSISNLRPDVYFIRVFNGNEWKTQKIIKN
ncbi:T9SS type A sorting domain-containing protein [Flavihumibacter sp. ZG627]|uniref:T9SS type A sorting domain-containing protein n=1 Tax=Flavihumibacter sp. ZG627 TaxID=1463156 RepID=UPI0012E08FE4